MGVTTRHWVIRIGDWHRDHRWETVKAPVVPRPVTGKMRDSTRHPGMFHEPLAEGF